ncbi:PilT/PilU family type 4a pilus ATPase [Pelomicrobium methylotrophicum]|uniref:PilT/PilU family type 4a pilus ATPase n=1 Tax=Pelomicrobium methylotrophicum TaxID=2602750 RepID=A0A5C7EP88_9PROT|nr:PilT/PilU family type 4a pilus ATPase [Pelomicrobium methylotrophicum]TXF13685.1 PilT/PilU family type 4a pilus ATPase [Pelomicrobium methylotrophicum]
MIIAPLLKLMVEKQASDLFFTVGAPIQIKINGVCMPVNDKPLESDQMIKLAYGLMTEDQIRTFEATMEMNFSFNLPEVANYRVNIFRQRGDVAMVIRHIKSTIPTIEELNLPLILKDLIMERRGLILVVGPTGSGKSSTLAAMIEYRSANRTGHILTVEDPIEFVFKHRKSIVNQREIGTDTISYSNALTNAMREAPDLLMIGEIRDRETLRHGIIYALTGHLCISTLHANNSYHALSRIINFFPYETRAALLADLAVSLKAIISQRLVRGVDGKLLPAVEILLNTTHISELIKKGEIDAIKEAMETTVSPGSQTFEQALFKMYQAGKITREEAMAQADSPTNLAALIDYGQLRVNEAGMKAAFSATEELPIKIDLMDK